MVQAAASQNGLSKIDLTQIRLRLLAISAELRARGSARDLLDLKRVEAALGKMARGGRERKENGACGK